MRSTVILALCLMGSGCGGDDAEKVADPPGPAWIAVKTAIHVHSVQSHDACDGEPRVAGEPNAPCAQDLRDGICRTRYDHVFLTDHDAEMATVPWSELLVPIYRPGDAWVGGEARYGLSMTCPDGHVAHVYPGAENDLMPIGLDRHVGEDLEIDSPQLHDLYDKSGAENVAAFKAAGGVVLVNHPEQRTTEEIDAYGIDGIEIYNIHATLGSLLSGEMDLGPISPFFQTGGGGAPPDLLFLAMYADNLEDLAHWSILSHTRRLAGFAAHDVHRNAVPGALDDGERLDSYRRVLSWYSNRVFVPADPGPTREAVREAIKQGRSYLSGDVVGDTAGFDAVVRSRDGEVEVRMGDEAPWTEGMELEVTMPLSTPQGAELVTAVVEMRADGTWEDVLTTAGWALEPQIFPLPSAGVYRLEVRMTPKHLADRLMEASWLAEKSFLWVRTNPFHLR